jgi:hypothetical protein
VPLALVGCIGVLGMLSYRVAFWCLVWCWFRGMHAESIAPLIAPAQGVLCWNRQSLCFRPAYVLPASRVAQHAVAIHVGAVVGVVRCGTHVRFGFISHGVGNAEMQPWAVCMSLSVPQLSGSVLQFVYRGWCAAHVVQGCPASHWYKTPVHTGVMRHAVLFAEHTCSGLQLHVWWSEGDGALEALAWVCSAA